MSAGQLADEVQRQRGSGEDAAKRPRRRAMPCIQRRRDLRSAQRSSPAAARVASSSQSTSSPHTEPAMLSVSRIRFSAMAWPACPAAACRPAAPAVAARSGSAPAADSPALLATIAGRAAPAQTIDCHQGQSAQMRPSHRYSPPEPPVFLRQSGLPMFLSHACSFRD